MGLEPKPEAGSVLGRTGPELPFPPSDPHLGPAQVSPNCPHPPRLHPLHPVTNPLLSPSGL